MPWRTEPSCWTLKVTHELFRNKGLPDTTQVSRPAPRVSQVSRLGRQVRLGQKASAGDGAAAISTKLISPNARRTIEPARGPPDTQLASPKCEPERKEAPDFAGIEAQRVYGRRDMRGPGIREHFRWPFGLDAVWLSSPLFVIALSALLSPVRPFDYFWALVQGRACVQLGHVPTSNLFLFTLPQDAPFFDQPWLSQMALFGAYAAFGHSANVVLLALLLALAFALVIDAALRNGALARHAAWLSLCAVPLVALGSGVRSQMFAYPCFAFFVRQVTLPQERCGLGSLALVGATAAVWANVHGSFVLAPLMLAVHAFALLLTSARRTGALGGAKSAVQLFLVASLGTLVNPRGPLVYAYVAHYSRAVQATGATDVAEWQAPAWTSPVGILVLVLLAAMLVTLGLQRRELRLGQGLLLLLFGLLCCTSQRFLCWWALLAIAVVSPLFARPAKAPATPALPLANAALLGLLALVLLLCLPGMPLFERAAPGGRVPYAEARVLGIETPVRLGTKLLSGFQGRLFHDQALGGFVEWVLAERAPAPVAFVDQRFELTPPELWRDYFAISRAEGDWRARLARYGIDGLLIHEERAGGLVQALAAEPEWRLDGQEFGYRFYTRHPAPRGSSRSGKPEPRVLE